MKVTVTWKEARRDQGHCHAGMQLLFLGGIIQVLPPAYKLLRFFAVLKETNVCKTGGTCQHQGSVPHLKKKKEFVIGSPYFIFRAN